MTQIKWIKNGQDYRSSCGRFEIRRYIRRYGIEWGLIDTVCPVEREVSGAKSKLRDAKHAAQWRLTNRS